MGLCGLEPVLVDGTRVTRNAGEQGFEVVPPTGEREKGASAARRRENTILRPGGGSVAA